ncbi:hypothetical protein Fmac_025375 [Flemingia macrophylla]|uniref:Sulfotransferase n=1 Tax=Flemingia macrophylla TaxID=520843 RepID=A0ABD1LS24_9FABA
MAFTGEQQANEEDKLILSLPREKGWAVPFLYLFQDFWYPARAIQGVINSQKYFQAKDGDVVVASFPKSGTTWLKALTFAIVNRQHFSSHKNHPLLTSNPHQLVPFLDLVFSGDFHDRISNMAEPRLFGTHIPFPSLPKSIQESNCKVIYICRNPFDTFISCWYFFNKIKLESLPELTMKEGFEMYCKGIIGAGPWWNHMLCYWKESIDRPNKVLFLKYEDLKDDISFHVKRVAEFLGCPFTQDEEISGVIESVINLSSFEKMKDLEVNKSGTVGFIRNIEKKYFFRKAEVGDWVNYFSLPMRETLSKIIAEKFSGSGLSFKTCS